jgi:hypothetical protein
MDLCDYLTRNTVPKYCKDKVHTQLVLDFIDLIPHFKFDDGLKEHISPPYTPFREVRLLDPHEGFRGSADLVILNSKLYIIEAKVMHPERWTVLNKTFDTRKKETHQTIEHQIKKAHAFFKKHFPTDIECLGIYRLANSKEIFHHRYDFS